MTDSIIANYFVDENGFKFHDDSDEVISEAFTEFSKILVEAKKGGGETYHTELVWGVCTSSGRRLTDLLYGPSGIDADARRLLYGLLHKCQNRESPSLADGVLVGDGLAETASTGAILCALDLENQQPAALLTTNQSSIRGIALIRISQTEAELQASYIAEVNDFKYFWRQVPEICNLQPHAIETVAQQAFPESNFIEGVWSGAKEFEGEIATIRGTLISHLSGLDDHFLSVYGETNDPNRIAAEMGSRAGIDCSKESNRTRRNSKAMSSRVRSIGSKDLSFEWHTKLEAHRNRIHFAVDDGKLYIGIFCRHLEI
ncbi:hypothetical protein [Arthrobacter sp. CJ23]|uniref:hypothetical protein n=1 Tax=Arthrobacter sp. CJ23 TaxID=2972479 RepID=UPI00215B9C11|nr:hypothetical protein [Arthrobacter sp. CJ23]UVJ39017.1 hypothetical protein NVV90_17670 [Arthrobacter sp. CJ23]